MTTKAKTLTVAVLAPLAVAIGILLGQSSDGGNQAQAGGNPASAQHQSQNAGGAADEYTLDVPKLNEKR